MTVRGYPFDTTDPAGSVTELEWRRLMQWIMPSGVLRGADNAFAVTERAAGANMSVDVATGQAFIVGHYVRSDAVESVAIPDNATGNPRIDTIVVGFDFVANASSIYRVAGATAAAPAPAALTQDLTTKWEIPLAYVYVAAGENVSIVNAEISDRRQYADPQTQQQTKEPVRLATAAALAASTVTGVARVADANGALANIDGVAAVVGDRILDKDHATTEHRGIWTVEDVGSASKPWRMRRASTSDESAEVRAGMWVRVTEGATLADTGWLLTTNDPIVLGTTGLTFTQFPAASSGSSAPTDLWIPAASFALGSGSPSLAPYTSVFWMAWLFDAASEEGIATTAYIPTGWSTLDIDLWWTNAGAGSGDVRWDPRTNNFGDTETISSPAGSQSNVTAPAQNVMKVSTVRSGVTCTAGELSAIYLGREAANVADTLANDVAVFGIRLRKAS